MLRPLVSVDVYLLLICDIIRLNYVIFFNVFLSLLTPNCSLDWSKASIAFWKITLPFHVLDINESPVFIPISSFNLLCIKDTEICVYNIFISQ